MKSPSERSGEPDAVPHAFADEKEWAKAAEWYMCVVLRPYINRRKTYMPDVNAVLQFCRYGGFTREVAYKEAIKVLRKWNVTANRFDEEEKAVRRKLNLDSDAYIGHKS